LWTPAEAAASTMGKPQHSLNVLNATLNNGVTGVDSLSLVTVYLQWV
jgi:hypothetical protein